MNVYLDLHVLQSVPPSNVNRDDTGSPKTALFGGTRRARVSSQAWKRAMRLDFQRRLDSSDLGVRTKRLPRLLTDAITGQDPSIGEETAIALATELLTRLGFSLNVPRGREKEPDADKESEYLVFLSRRQIDNLADYAIRTHHSGEKISKKDAAAIAMLDHSIDIALFGRMVANLTDINVDAAAQVAHALSVHSVETEFDYFTAVDDVDNDDHAGAGMIGTVEFNSSTLYRYGTVNVPALEETLGDAEAAVRAVETFIESFVRSMPTGKQNTFANRTLPHAVMATVRYDQPINLAGAFEDAVTAGGGQSRLARAAGTLVEHANKLDEAFPPAKAPKSWVVCAHPDTEALAERGAAVSLEQLVAEVADELRSSVTSR
ncbi:type I-E CRISPR-associated protein Cas7/Cse4/CasC [Aeromicrobium camelliae]|uniref:Type I-E CRISPR-associated protein Cas7/Cse4/CasC n=1 Tax=Aeromicrobium camelliae TaxID=1538144 RepID=A0A3N6X559_9ACTN|nr:type I-E CRISPR-associated protein Cas7/Cse4/CasC [Aeromicrobium camelliae]RQN08798.1 type I-E CRISPR-associated protein Cas7/Cse4/CasC [Aeromicrobium camelliae]